MILSLALVGCEGAVGQFDGGDGSGEVGGGSAVTGGGSAITGGGSAVTGGGSAVTGGGSAVTGAVEGSLDIVILYEAGSIPAGFEGRMLSWNGDAMPLEFVSK